jgi:transposase
LSNFTWVAEKDITQEQADKKLTDWAINMIKKDNKYLDKFIKTLNNWYDYILNYFNGKWSNGIVEGINNRIKMIKRRALGFEDFASFRTRILVEFI